MKGIAREVEGSQFLVGDLETRWIHMAILEGGHRYPFFGRSMRDEFQNHFQGGERFGPPIDGNESKEPMLDLVPFARRRGIMHDRDRQLFFIGQVLKLFLPQPLSHPIGAATIGGDQQFLLAWIKRFAGVMPPSSETLDGELSGVMINASIDKAVCVDQIRDAIRQRFAIGKTRESHTR